MARTSHDIALLLQANAIGTMGTDIFINDEPDEPNNCITIYDTGGTSGQVTNVTTYKQPRIQIRVRNNKQSDGHAKAEAIETLMETNSRLRYRPAGASYKYTALYKQTEILFLPRDVKRRSICVQNFRCPRGQ